MAILKYISNDKYQFLKTDKGTFDDKAKKSFLKFIETQAGYVENIMMALLKQYPK